MSTKRTPAKVSTTNLIIASSRIASTDGVLYRLEEDYTNHADDCFLQGEALIMFNTGQLARIGAALCDPGICDYKIIVKEST